MDYFPRHDIVLLVWEDANFDGSMVNIKEATEEALTTTYSVGFRLRSDDKAVVLGMDTYEDDEDSEHCYAVLRVPRGMVLQEIVLLNGTNRTSD